VPEEEGRKREDGDEAKQLQQEKCCDVLRARNVNVLV